MRSVIQQTVTLPAPAETLFDMYLDAGRHAAFTGSEVTIAAKPGAPFSAFNGQLTGTVLAAVRPHVIVQSWRSMKFKESDRDSTLILTFTPAGDDGRIELVHLDVPAHDYDDVITGWQKYYWSPWRKYLENR